MNKFFGINKISLRAKLFIVMTLLLMIAGIMIMGSTTIQYRSQKENYHLSRLNRKVAQIERHLNHLVNKNHLFGKPYSIWMKNKLDFENINKIHNIQYSLFSIDGSPLFLFHTPLKIIANNYNLDSETLQKLKEDVEGNFTEEYNSDINKFHASYRVLKDNYRRSYGILFFPYFEDDSFAENELNTFLQNLYQIYILLLLGVILIAYFLSKYVTRSLETIRLKMDQTGLLQINEKIYLKDATKEIDSLVNSYNRMIDELEISATKLAKTERENAWQEMARQVAHEIKNPLTPMRLTIQSFQKKYNNNDTGNILKVNELSKILIEQIDSMSQVASAFSDFATLPKSDFKKCNIVKVIRSSINVFKEINIQIESNLEEIYHFVDSNQWLRVMNNLIKNSLQSMPNDVLPNIKIKIESKNKSTFIKIIDNGFGIPLDLQSKIFEPKFTTKNSGMGLGLGIVKNIIESHGGIISFTSTVKKGTTFLIELKNLKF
jgi:two-component system nitrogen regulation sensor histidine kinase NtrY